MEKRLYLGQTIYHELGEPEYIQYLADESTSKVAIQPLDEKEGAENAYSVSDRGLVHATPAWDAVGAVIGGSARIPADMESEDCPVIDLSEFVGVEESESEPESDGREDGTSTRRFEPGSDNDVLDRERVQTALDSVGIDDVDPEEFIKAVDLQPRIFQVATQLDIARGDADDLVQRLDLEDALDSDQDLARHRFEEGSA